MFLTKLTMFPSEFRILTELPPSVLSMADSRLWRRVKKFAYTYGRWHGSRWQKHGGQDRKNVSVYV